MKLLHLSTLVGVIATLANAAPQDRLQIHLEKDRVSAKIQNAPIRAFLDELAAQIRVEIVTAEEIAGDSISAEFQKIPLEDALRTVLAAYDVFYYYQSGSAGTHSIRGVWVYPAGAAKSLRPVPPNMWAGAKELESDLSDSDPQIRAKVYEVLMDRPDGRSRDLLLQALRGRETDESVRQRVLSGAVSKGVDLSPAVLAELARTDGSEQIRCMALDALPPDGSARDVAEALKTDPSEAVRQRAIEKLAELSAADRRRDRPPVNSEPDR